MPYNDYYNQCVLPFERVYDIRLKDKGHIVWRRGTGDNTELLHIRTYHKKQGYGRELFYYMLSALQNDPPYYSVFGFTRTGNEETKLFYGALGFNLQTIAGIYKEGQAILFWQSYEILLAKKKEYENLLCSEAQSDKL